MPPLTNDDEYDDVVAGVVKSDADAAATQIRNNAVQAVGVNPDQEAQHQQLAKATGMPIQAVRADPAVAQQQVAAATVPAMALAQKTPVTAKFLSNADKFKLAQDDYNNMSDTEVALQQPPGLVSDAFTGGVSTGLKVLGAWDKAAVALDGIMPDALKMTPEQKAFYTERGRDYTDAGLEGSPQRWTGQIVSGLSYVPFLEAAPAVVAGTEGSARTQELEEKGVDPTTAQEAGTVDGAFQAFLQLLPLGKFAFSKGLLPAAKSVAAATAKAGAGGAAQSVLTDAATQQLLNQGGYADLAKQYAPSTDKAVDSAFFMAALHSGMEGAHAGIDALSGAHDMTSQLSQSLSAAHEAAAAGRASTTMADLNNNAVNSKLRARDPDTYEQFIADAAKDGPAENIYVDPKALAQSGVDLNKLAQVSPSVAEQLPDALATGSDLKVPSSEFAARIAGTEYAQPFVEHGKFDPNGMSKAEGDAFFQGGGTKQLNDAFSNMLKEKEGDDVFTTGMKNVENDIADKLGVANRFRDDVNRPYATVASRLYGVLAAREGMTPEEFYKQYPLTINTEAGLGEHLDQAPGGDPEINMRYQRDLKTVLGGAQLPGRQSLLAGTTPAGLKALGRPEWPLRVPSDVVRKAVAGSGKHEIAESVLQKLPELLADPHAIFDSATRPGDHVLALNARDTQGRPIIASVRTNPETRTHFVTSIHGREGGDAWLQEQADAGRLRYVDENKSPVRPRTAGLQLPGERPINPVDGAQGSFTNVVKKADLVKDGKFYQGNRGAFDPVTRTLSLLKSADLSTFLHESGHLALEMMNDLASRPGASDAVKADMDAVLKWTGEKGETPEERLASWNNKTLDEKRQAHEQFARGFEKYLFEGKAPAVGLQGVFQRFAAWLKHVYQGADALNVTLSPEIRGVFDRMLATGDEIKEAEAARNFKPLFDTAKAAGMTKEQFRAYQEENIKGTADAQDQLTSRSLRDMQWLSNAKKGELRRLQGEAAAKRKAILKEVREEVMAEPVNKARTFFKRGELEGQKVEGPHRLDIKDVQAKVDDARMSGDAPIPIETLESKFGKYGILGENGIHPDTAAEMFGYSSGTELIKDLLNAEDPHEKISAVTDQRMLERHGDIADPEAMERAAEEAIHNDAHIKFAATEMHKLQEKVKANKLPVQVAKAVASRMIAGLKVSDINPTRYVAAGARASRNAEKAFAKGDHATAALEKQNEVVQRYAAKEAYAAQKEVEKSLAYLKRFDRKTVREAVGTDIEHIDALLDQYDLRRTQATNAAIRKDSLVKWYESQHDAGYEPLINDDMLTSEQRIHYKDLSVEAFRGLTDAVKSIEHVAKEAKTITHNGQKVLVDNIVNEFTDRMADRGEKFTKEELLNPPQKGVDSFVTVALHKIGVALRLVNTDLRPTDYKADSYDMHELGGPFRKYIFDRIFDRNYWKTDNLRALSDEFKEKQAALGKEWQRSLFEHVTNKTLADPDLSVEGQPPVMMKITRAKLIGIARHVGNESNFAKLTKGMNWAPVDVWNFLHENMREKDWKAVDGEWKSFEKFWPETEAMIRRLGGVVPEKIPLRPFDTKFGKMDGGYAPIDYDPLRSKLSAKFGEISLDPTQSIAKPEYYKATTTRNGSLNNRQEGYTDRLNLDYHYVTRRLNETIHDLAYREALIDAGKIIDHPKFKQTFMQTYGREEYTGLLKFFEDVKGAQMRDDQMDRFEHAMQYTRQGIIMTGVAYRLSTVFKHGTSAALKSLGYTAGGGQKYLLARVKALAGGERETQIAEAQKKFPEIRTRMLQMDRDYKAGNVTMYEPESWKAKNDRYGHMLVAWSDALSAIPLAHAAYDWATTEGIPKKLGGTGAPMSHEDAVRYANQTVREAHGSALETARSNFMRDRGAKSLLGIIYGFQNNTYGQLSGMIDQVMTGKGDRPAVLAKAMAVLVAPSVAAYYLSQGGVQDDEHWYSWMAKAITGEVASTVPLVREAWTMIEQRMAHREVDPGAMPVLKMLADVVKTGGDLYDEFEGKETKVIQDAANALGEWLHIGGLGQAGKTLQYMRDVHDGKQQPQSAAEAVQGATIGVHNKKKH